MEGLLTPFERETLALSLRVGAWAVAGALPVAVAAGWLLARREFPGRLLVDGLLHLPLVLPPVVTGYALLLLFGRHGPVGAWLEATFGATLAFTWQGAALAAAVMALPLMVRAVRLSMAAVDPGLEEAARTLGAGRLRVFVTVTLPLAGPGVLTAVILGFARALSEFGATITFVSNIPGETRILPLALYSLIQSPGGEAGALRLAVIAAVVALGALLASEVLARRMRRRLAA